MNIVIGIDEAGRGALAGPVVASAVYLNQEIIGIKDSKKLSKLKRESLYEQIAKYGKFGIGIATPNEIDQLNILNATMLAMQRAYENIALRANLVLVDGNKAPKFDADLVQTIINGDNLEMIIAAASIMAKVTRDNLMLALDKSFPIYDWKNNFAYGTKNHLKIINEYGPSIHHRMSFAPIKFLKINN